MPRTIIDMSSGRCIYVLVLSSSTYSWIGLLLTFVLYSGAFCRQHCSFELSVSPCIFFIIEFIVPLRSLVFFFCWVSCYHYEHCFFYFSLWSLFCLSFFCRVCGSFFVPNVFHDLIFQAYSHFLWLSLLLYNVSIFPLQFRVLILYLFFLLSWLWFWSFSSYWACGLYAGLCV